jgi:hypothetical protein
MEGPLHHADTALHEKLEYRPTGDLGWLTQGGRWVGTQQQVQNEASSDTPFLGMGYSNLLPTAR